MDQVPAAFTPTVSARVSAMTSKYRIEGASTCKIDCTYPPGGGAHEKDMFIAMARPVLDAILSVWEVSVALYCTVLYCNVLYCTVHTSFFKILFTISWLSFSVIHLFFI